MLPVICGPGSRPESSSRNAAGHYRSTISVEVALPEIGAAAAVAELVVSSVRIHILDKDILSVDLRVPGRMFVRLSESAAAERAAALAQKSKSKGART